MSILRSERSWVQTFSGRKFYPLNPRPDEVYLEDIAHALSCICRFGGHCKSFYSVSEHSVLVSLTLPQYGIEALLHDAAEAYLGDVPRPLKHQPEWAQFRDIENRVLAAVYQRFGVNSTPQSHDEIKKIDDRILVDEVTALATNPSLTLETKALKGLEPVGVNVQGNPWWLAERIFLSRAAELGLK